jgi:hypothetical protein
MGAVVGGEWSTSRPCLFTPAERPTGTHRTGPRAGLNDMAGLEPGPNIKPEAVLGHTGLYTTTTHQQERAGAGEQLRTNCKLQILILTTATVKVTIDWEIHRVVWQLGTTATEKPAVSIFINPEDEDTTILRNIWTYLPLYIIYQKTVILKF